MKINARNINSSGRPENKQINNQTQTLLKMFRIKNKENKNSYIIHWIFFPLAPKFGEIFLSNITKLITDELLCTLHYMTLLNLSWADLMYAYCVLHEIFFANVPCVTYVHALPNTKHRKFLQRNTSDHFVHQPV